MLKDLNIIKEPSESKLPRRALRNINGQACKWSTQATSRGGSPHISQTNREDVARQYVTYLEVFCKAHLFKKDRRLRNYEKVIPRIFDEKDATPPVYHLNHLIQVVFFINSSRHWMVNIPVNTTATKSN